MDATTGRTVNEPGEKSVAHRIRLSRIRGNMGTTEAPCMVNLPEVILPWAYLIVCDGGHQQYEIESARPDGSGTLRAPTMRYAMGCLRCSRGRRTPALLFDGRLKLQFMPWRNSTKTLQAATQGQRQTQEPGMRAGSGSSWNPRRMPFLRWTLMAASFCSTKPRKRCLAIPARN